MVSLLSTPLLSGLGDSTLLTAWQAVSKTGRFSQIRSKCPSTTDCLPIFE